MRVLSIIALAACMAAEPVCAQITFGAQSIPVIRGLAFEPVNPVAGQDIAVVFDGPVCGVAYSATRNANIIAVEVKPILEICPLPPGARIRFSLGKLPAGEYTIRRTSYRDFGMTGTLVVVDESIMVVAAASSAPALNYSGMWNDPAATGWGIGFIQSASGQAFATLYGYDSVGAPTWYGVPGGVWTSPSRFEGTMFVTQSSSGGPVASGYFALSPAGRMTIQFDALGGARLDYVLYVWLPPGSVSAVQVKSTESRNIRKLLY